jgi:hypothetical protein
MDYYLKEQNCIDRLVEEWSNYGKIVLGIDFDDTLYDFHKKGRKYDNVIALIKRCQVIGCHTVVFTANDDTKHYEFIKEYLSKEGIQVDTVNDNIPSVPFKTRKVYYNILLDDRAGLSSAYSTLLRTVEIMESKR